MSFLSLFWGPRVDHTQEPGVDLKRWCGGMGMPFGAVESCGDDNWESWVEPNFPANSQGFLRVRAFGVHKNHVLN